MELEFWFISEIYFSILLPLCFFIESINAGVSSAFLCLGVSQITFKFSFSSFRDFLASWLAASYVGKFVISFSI